MEIGSNNPITQTSIPMQNVSSTGHNLQTREIENVSKSNELDGLNQDELKNKMKDVTKELNTQMERLETNIRFDYDGDVNLMIVKVTEASTGEVIRELPTKEALKISKYFKESIGLLFDKES
ncbi:FlaG family protein [Campylobacter mucosalis]|uniref:FlaG family protein n=1 Tax=Campylobacter mucosalis TaxID=202 RepID=UPI00068D66C0|nr:FlaG family protein [Campylobacter mucosalis]QKF62988.1 flagellar protein FlaG [Campylobacter mucosalis]